MEDKIKCPFCGNLTESDGNFCINCGKKLPAEDSNLREQKFIECPVCKALNNEESIECEGCGYLLKRDIKKISNIPDENKYKRCHVCGNILSSDDSCCDICGRPVKGEMKCECGYESNFKTPEEICCINCGRPVSEGQLKCECGYELADIKCMQCGASNPYTNTFCTSCESPLWHCDFTLPVKKPKGCIYMNNNIVLDIEFLKKESLKDPYKINDEVHSSLLLAEFNKYMSLNIEICSRWWIASPFRCKSCHSKIEPLDDYCPVCNVAHHSAIDKNRVGQIKCSENGYGEAENCDELSKLKWTYNLDGDDLKDYTNSLAPQIGESQLEYLQRLFGEWGEISAILYLIKSDWNVYFKNRCMNCGGEFEAYNLCCPSCGMEKEVTALGVYFDNSESLDQYGDFSRQVKNICADNGGDISNIDDGIAGCPKCFNYFNYLSSDFINTHRCPHCGVEFEISAESDNVNRGDYCSIHCIHFRENFEPVNGEEMDFSFCDLGNNEIYNRNFCRDFE